MHVGFKTDKGILRSSNEDACFVLLHDKGYELVEATPCDMFPNSAHVETVALIQKRKSN